jgi:hypothetical protein
MDDYEPRLAEVLTHLLSWRLTEEGWSSVEEALNRLAAARHAGDRATEGRLAAVLLLSDVGRVAGGLAEAMEEPPRRTASPRTRDVVYRLIRDLGELAGEPEEPRRAEQDRR